MALRNLVFFLLLLVAANSFAQVPILKWQKTFGGAANEMFYIADYQPAYQRALLEVPGGYIIAGETYSSDGDITGKKGVNDIWVAKLDSARNILWSRCLGGLQAEIFGSIAQDTDGGFIICGGSESNDAFVTGNHGSQDVWVVKISGSGIVEWQKTYGGSQVDIGGSIATVGNGGYIFTAYSNSSNGDVTGNHGAADIWVVKIDRSGNILWQHALGGSIDDADYIIKPAPDGGFIVMGAAFSNDGDVQGWHGGWDNWVVKLSAAGVIQWQKCLGGAAHDYGGDIEFTPDGGYLLVGSTESNDGDVSANHGQYDAWAVKLSAAGQIQWQKCFGGSGSESFSDVIVMPDGSYVAAGQTSSANGDVSFNAGVVDQWMVRFDANGNLIWERTFGGSGSDFVSSVLPSYDDEFILFGETSSTNGDVTGQHGGRDFWLTRTGASNIIEGAVYYDLNSNGAKESNEPFAAGVKVTSEKSGFSRSSAVSLNGRYRIPTDTGSFTTRAIAPAYFNSVPVSSSSVFTSYFNTSTINFALQPISGQQDLQVILFPVTPARPGFQVHYRIIYKNVGTVPVSNTSIRFVKNSKLSVVNTIPAYSNFTADTLTWNLSTLNPVDTGTIILNLQVAAPPVANIGDTLRTYAVIFPVAGDLTPADDTSRLNQLVTGSYDPNDKKEGHTGKLSQQQVAERDWLTYVIRFQNTGSDTAFNITVRDTLDAKLDWETFSMIASSHNYLLNMQQNRIAWEFRNILLPDSNRNEPASHGYIVYRIKTKNTLIAGDTIKNSASIYFDYNLPERTNIENTVVIANAVLPVRLAQFEGVLKNNIVHLSWKTVTEQGTKLFEVERSVDGLKYDKIGTVNAKGIANGAAYALSDATPVSGYNYYRLKIIDLDGKYVYSSIVILLVKSAGELVTTLYPNPSTDGNISINIYGSINGVCTIDVLDMSGRQVIKKNLGSIKADSYSTLLRLSGLQKGVYTLRLSVAGSMTTHKLVIR